MHAVCVEVQTRGLLGIVLVAACSASPRLASSVAPAAASALPAVASAPASAPAIASASPSSTSSAPPAPSLAPIGSEEADQILFADDIDADARAACLRDPPERDRIACLLRVRYRGDDEATRVAVALYTQSGNLAGVQPTRLFDGGYRGMLKFVPAVPTGASRTHLAWVAAAFRDYEALFAGLSPSNEPQFRWRALELRFFRSVNARTPSAFAQGWTIGYNLGGSLNVSEQWVRETLFHELFHLNDEAHGHWSDKALAPIHESIKAKCGASTPCLTPYAPSATIVNGSTYYAFHPQNPVSEYGGELALRYYREHRALLRHEPTRAPAFKCMTLENARAWQLVVDEFFAGIDRVPPCATHAEPGRR